MSRSTAIPVLIATLALALPGCGSSSPSDPTVPGVPTTETFTGTLLTHSSMWHPFTVTREGPLEIKLTQTTAAGAVGLGLGQVTTGCVLLAVNSAAVVGTAISGTLKAGAYCVSLYDVGTVTEPVSYTVTVTHS